MFSAYVKAFPKFGPTSKPEHRSTQVRSKQSNWSGLP